MAKTICQASAATVASTANTTQYWTIAGFIKANTSANKARSEIKFRSAGTLSNLLVKLSANSVATTGCTFTLHKNGSNVTQTMAIGASATGDFEDTTHTDSVADGDLFCLETDPIPTTGTFSMSLVSMLFDATTNTVTKIARSDSFNYAVASGTNYSVFQAAGAGQGTETNTNSRMRVAGTLRDLGVYVSANRATATTFRLRKSNSTNGNNTATVTGGGAAGWYEDTSSTDTVTAGEDWNFGYTTGAGVDTITPQTIQCEFESTNGDGILITGVNGGQAVTDATTVFYYISGSLVSYATETGATGCQTKAREAFTFSELSCNVTANSVTAASTLTLRKNAVDTSIVVSITASTTGKFSDSVNQETVTATDQMSYEVTAPSVAGTQTVTLRTISMVSHLTTLARVSLSRIYKYDVIGRISLQRIYKYNISQRVNATSVFFDGIDDWIDLGSHTDLWSLGKTKFSFSLWMYPTAINDGGIREVLDQFSGSAHGWICEIGPTNAGEIIFRIKNSVNTAFNAISTALVANQWQFITCVYDNSLGSANVKIYVNAVVGGTTANLTETISAVDNVELSSDTNDFKGFIKDFKWWTTTALSQTQINALYTNSSSGAPTPNYWLPLNEGTGTTVTDTISGSKTGTFTGNPLWKSKAPEVLQGLSRVYKYNVLSRISLSRIYKYHLLARISLSRIYKWNVLALARISLSRTYKYHVLGRTSLSRIYKYHVAKRVSLSRIYKYHILARTSLSRIYKYHVLGRVSLVRIYKYNKIGRVSLARVYKYNLIGRVSLARIYRYHVATRVSLVRIYKYHVARRVSLARIYKYHLAIRVSLSRIYRYHVLGRVALTRIYKYHVLGRVSLARIYKYNKIGRISLSRIYKYNVQARVSLARIYRYHILGRISLARIYKYNLIARVSLARIYLWNVVAEGLIRISLARTYKYHIANRVSLSRIYRFHVATRVSLQRIYKYHLLGRISLQRIYKYNVIARTSLLRVYKYNVIGRVSLPRIYKYHIQARVSLSRIYKYNLLGRISLARIYKWHLATRVSLARVYKYNLIARVSLARVYKWDIASALARISKQQIYKYHVLGRISLQRIYKYDVLTRVALARIYKYHIATRVSLARVYKYHILARISSIRTYKYNLLGRVSLSRIYKYHVLQRISASKVYKWNVLLGLFRISKEQVYKYNVIARLSNQLRLRYNIATLAITQWGKVREWIYARYAESDPSKQ